MVMECLLHVSAIYNICDLKIFNPAFSIEQLNLLTVEAIIHVRETSSYVPNNSA